MNICISIAILRKSFLDTAPISKLLFTTNKVPTSFKNK